MSSRLTRGLARSASEIELDEHLHELGFWRKMIPKDGNCLFRIASEKVNCYEFSNELCFLVKFNVKLGAANMFFSEIFVDIMDIKIIFRKEN